ncbi:MarR family transcriptional regulator [Streptomyces sp. 71268]|uniref:MarR family winged helix-turn-helix transcriptional regulator n=1 Tax=Streptomyces sp. 71268 TaxID=3002640 RepID=UPI0023F7C3DB|nr:MarR family transcriptional regulator [Streptomyces sp. 71268]WEV27409.1 MarR family transcriptional regulator [Streptomyces sp. 71268]
MPAPDAGPDSACCSETTDAVSGIAELLDVMWERARDATARATAPASVSQLRLMYVVDRQDGMRMRRLCQLLASSPPNVSRMCDRLQTLGFLERLPCPDNGREVALRLSAAGRGHLQRVREERENVLHEALHGMAAHQRLALAQGLTELATRLTTHDEAPSDRPLPHLSPLTLLPRTPLPSPWVDTPCADGG